VLKHASFAAARAARDFAASPDRLHLRFLIALSGGPDSVALLLAMSEAVDLSRLAACWIDHGLRSVGELSREQQFVEGLCERLDIPLKIARIPRGQIVAEAGRDGGIEAAARRFRYAALEDARQETASDLILTAHTADDWLETMLMRFFSGSGTAGLKGIPQLSLTLARPFLELEKNEVLDYLQDRGQDFSVDSSNLGTDFLRNRVRQEVVPQVLDTFPFVRSALKTLACKARLDDEALESWVDRLFDSGNLPASAFFAAPVAVRIRALYRLSLNALVSEGATDAEGALDAEGAGAPSSAGAPQAGSQSARRLPWAFMENAASASSSATILGQGAGLKILVLHGFIRVEQLQPALALPTGVLAGGFSIEVRSPGRFRIGTALDCRLYCRPEPGGLRLDAFEWPLVVRSRRSGDSIRLSAGLRRIDRLLADLQVPRTLRDRVPLVEDRTGIVAVLGSSIGSRDIYRRNDVLSGHASPGFLVLEMKGVVSDDAVQR
jgi:tRNA(Ile)-lysidine synthase